MPTHRIHAVVELREVERRGGEQGIVAAKLLHLYDFACSRPGGLFLELGTDRGQATNVILEACGANGSRLVSVDILDCSSAASGEEWQFIRCSSIDQESVLKGASYLAEGIDMVYVDSKHSPDHVMAEINLWMPYLKNGGRMYFDDIDAGPYMSGARKDNAAMEVANRAILQVVTAYFRKNIDHLRFTVMYGSSGLAWIDKLSALAKGHELRSDELMRDRRFIWPYRILKKLGLYRPYIHRRDGSDFLLK